MNTTQEKIKNFTFKVTVFITLVGVLLSVSGAALLLSPNNVYAATLYSQEDDSVEGTNQGTTAAATILIGSSGLSGNVGGVIYRFNPTGVTLPVDQDLSVTLYEGAGGLTDCSAVGTIRAQGTGTWNGTDTQANIQFSSGFGFSLDNTKTYCLAIAVPADFSPSFVASKLKGINTGSQRVWYSSNTPFPGLKDAFYILYDTNGPPSEIPPDTSTRIITVTPQNNTLISTSTSVIVANTGYINANEYEDGIKIRQRLSLSTSPLLGGIGVGPYDAVNQLTNSVEFVHIATSSGPFSFSTTTSLTQIGVRNMTTTITKPRFSVFGRGFGTTVLYSTTTKFTVGTTTRGDIINQNTQDQLELLTGSASSTIESLNDSCNPFSLGDFSALRCAYLLVVPDAETLSVMYQDLNEKILTKAPLGYVTRLVSILTSTTTTALPTISYTTASTSMFGTMTFEFDPFGALTASTSPLNYTSDQSQPKTIWQIMEEVVNITIYLMLFFMIVHDITGVSRHKNKIQ